MFKDSLFSDRFARKRTVTAAGCLLAAERGIVLLYDSSPARGLTSRLVSEADSAPRKRQFLDHSKSRPAIIGLTATKPLGAKIHLTSPLHGIEFAHRHNFDFDLAHRPDGDLENEPLLLTLEIAHVDRLSA